MFEKWKKKYGLEEAVWRSALQTVKKRTRMTELLKMAIDFHFEAETYGYKLAKSREDCMKGKLLGEKKMKKVKRAKRLPKGFYQSPMESILKGDMSIETKRFLIEKQKEYLRSQRKKKK